MSAVEHLADCTRDDRSGHSEPWFDRHGVMNDAAERIVQQGAFMPPDALLPAGGRLAIATPIG